MNRSLSIISIAVLGSALMGAVAAYAQTPAAPACGVETYSVADQKYVTVPCAGGAPAATDAAKPGAAPTCGVETYSVADQRYVGTPCPSGLTYENPGYVAPK